MSFDHTLPIAAINSWDLTQLILYNNTSINYCGPEQPNVVSMVIWDAEFEFLIHFLKLILVYDIFNN